MIHIIITAYGEPKSTERTINAFLNQNIEEKYTIIVSDPFQKVQEYLKKKFRTKKNVQFYKDEGEGKSYALNIILSDIFSKNTNDLILCTDGDVVVGKNTVNELINAFKDKQVGVVCGHPVSINKRNTMFGYWSHLLLDGADKTRRDMARKRVFMEVSGYLFAMRNGVINSFPLNASEDSIIPFLFWKNGYKIGYAKNANVFVLSPQNMKDWINQKKRNIKGHARLNEYFKEEESTPRTKTFMNEVRKGLGFSLLYPRSVREIIWNFMLYVARIYVWIAATLEMRVKKKKYTDGWRKDSIESTKPLD